MPTREPQPRHLQDLPEVDEAEPEGQVEKVETRIGATTPRELQEKFGIILILEGGDELNKEQRQQTLENLDDALDRLVTEKDENVIKNKGVFIEPKNLHKSRGADIFSVNWGSSVEDMYRSVELTADIAPILQNLGSRVEELKNILALDFEIDYNSPNLNLETIKNFTKILLRLRFQTENFEFPNPKTKFGDSPQFQSKIYFVDDKQPKKSRNLKHAGEKHFKPTYYVQWGDTAENIQADLLETYKIENGELGSEDTTEELPEV